MFNIKKIQKNIYLIWEPWYKEFANIFLFKDGKDCLVFDAGLGCKNLRQFLKSKKFSKIKIAITHAHFDHCGGLKHFKSKEIIITKKQLRNIKKKLLGLNYFKASDFLFEANFSQKNFLFSNLKKIKTSKEKNIKFGDFNFQIITAPGHSDDSLIFFEKKHKLLITGDAFYTGKIYLDFPNSDKSAYFKTLEKIRKINCQLILPGHNSLIFKKKNRLTVLMR